jgi:hypothetical protein
LFLFLLLFLFFLPATPVPQRWSKPPRTSANHSRYTAYAEAERWEQRHKTVVVGGPVAGRLGFACNARNLFCSFLRTKRTERKREANKRRDKTCQ